MSDLTSDEIKAVATYLWGPPRTWQDASRDNGLSLVASGFTVLWIAGRKYFDYAEALLSPDGRAAMEGAVISRHIGIEYARNRDDSEWVVTLDNGLLYIDQHKDPAEAMALAILELVKERK
jgi:hypothetical protein